MKNVEIAGTKIRPAHKFSTTQRLLIFDLICYVFVLLFVYTAASKLSTIDIFKSVLVQYPLIGAYHNLIAYSVPVVELMVAVFLILPSTRKPALKISLTLMLCFLSYIVYMFISKSDLPCSCGGIIAKLSWQQHMFFNSCFAVLALIGIRMKPE